MSLEGSASSELDPVPKAVPKSHRLIVYVFVLFGLVAAFRFLAPQRLWASLIFGLILFALSALSLYFLLRGHFRIAGGQNRDGQNQSGQNPDGSVGEGAHKLAGLMLLRLAGVFLVIIGTHSVGLLFAPYVALGMAIGIFGLALGECFFISVWARLQRRHLDG